MEDMVLTDDLKVGLEVFDYEHGEMVVLLNRLNHLLAMGKKRKALSQAMLALINYTKFHFTHEQSMMEKFNYSETEEHRAGHEKLLSQICSFHESLEKGEAVLTDDELYFFKHWLIDHIKEKDMKYREFFTDDMFC